MMVLLLGSILGVILLGFTIAHHMDGFVNHGGIIDSLQGRANRGVLLYGAPDAASYIEKADIRCTLLLHPDFPADGFYSALFALSISDQHNLLLCHQAKQADPDLYVVVRCNQPELESLYRATGAAYILGAGESIHAFLQQLGGIEV